MSAVIRRRLSPTPRGASTVRNEHPCDPRLAKHCIDPPGRGSHVQEKHCLPIPSSASQPLEGDLCSRAHPASARDRIAAGDHEGDECRRPEVHPRAPRVQGQSRRRPAAHRGARVRPGGGAQSQARGLSRGRRPVCLRTCHHAQRRRAISTCGACAAEPVRGSVLLSRSWPAPARDEPAPAVCREADGDKLGEARSRADATERELGEANEAVACLRRDIACLRGDLQAATASVEAAEGMGGAGMP
jgi:hypothetical protein